jgi:hypothetical protein
MEQVLFGDIFINIEQHLFPINLHNLLLSCRKYSQMITENRIKLNTINEIKKQLQENLGGDYVEFMDMMQRIDGAIIGTFISQCLHGEKCNNIHICVTKAINMIVSSESSDKYDYDKGIVKFMMNKGSTLELKIRTPSDNSMWRIFISTLAFQVNNVNINLYALDDSKLSSEAFIHNYMEYNANKNMYNFAKDEIYINRIDEIFAKVTNVSRFSNLGSDFSIMYEQGYKFYRPETPKKIMSNDEILYSFFNVVKMQRKNYDTKISGRFITKDNLIYHRKEKVDPI